MKNLLIICLMVLLGQFPLEIWEKGTLEQQMIFIQEVAEKYLEISGCKRVSVMLVTDGEIVFVVADCLDDGKVKL